jgi:hypothetical protein
MNYRETYALSNGNVTAFKVDMYGKQQRSIRWELPVDGQEQGEDGRYVVVSCSHDKDWKRFSTVVGDEIHSSDRGFLVRQCHPMEWIRPDRGQGVDRYSKKALMEYFQTMFVSDNVVELVARFVDNPTITKEG